MKILFFINSLGAGGAERSMVELAKFLHDRPEVNVKFVCIKRKEIGLEQEVSDHGIEAIYFEDTGGFFSKLKFVSNTIKDEKPDIIHSVLAESNLLIRFSRLFSKRGIVVQSLVNTPYTKERKKDLKLPQYKFQIIKLIDKFSVLFDRKIFFHAITNEVLRHYRSLYNINNNYRVIYRGRSRNQHLGEVEKNKSFTIVNSGRQEFQKGQIDILKALKFIKDEHFINDIHLEILGRPGSYSPFLEQFVKENGLENQVTFQGFVNDVELKLVQSHLFAFPSYFEGLGGALIEAFAAGLPCVVSDIPVLREVVGDKNGAKFASPGDHENLARHILELYNNEKDRNELSKYALKRFKEKFQLKKINEEMLDMYKQLLKSDS